MLPSLLFLLLLSFCFYHEWWIKMNIFGRYAARCVSALMGLVTLIFDPLTLKLVWKSHQRCGTFLPNLGTLDLWVHELFATYAKDGRTDGQTYGQKQRLLPPFPTGGGNNVSTSCLFVYVYVLIKEQKQCNRCVQPRYFSYSHCRIKKCHTMTVSWLAVTHKIW